VIATESDAENSGPPPVPVVPNIHTTIYAAASSKGALDMGQWHKCEKTHCRAGWAVALAGKPGFALERFYGGEGSGTTLAAMMIYDASDLAFKINPCRFFDDNDEALADMKRLAKQSA
ncbi:MAG: hypothetical protein ACREBP_10220, partial [Sphingomicrobium sp.]